MKTVKISVLNTSDLLQRYGELSYPEELQAWDIDDLQEIVPKIRGDHFDETISGPVSAISSSPLFDVFI